MNMMTINLAKSLSATKTIRVKVPSSQSPSFDQKVPCLSTQLLFQNHSNFNRSGEPSRVMYYENGLWIDFDSEVVIIFRPEFLERRSIVEASVNDCKYLFDFLRMLQIEFFTGKQRSIAWIDVHGRCFFPKLFVDDNFSNKSGALESEEMRDIDIEIDVKVKKDLNPVNSGKRKREVVEVSNDDDDYEEEDEGEEEISDESSSSNEHNFSKRLVTSSELGIIKWSCAKLVKEEERVYSVVTKLFLSGIKNVDPYAAISCIHQCTRTDTRELARWEVFRKTTEATKAARGVANTIFAWYGTSAKGIESILMHEFEMPSKVSGSESYGVGIHVSPVSLPHLSVKQSEVDDNGEKHVILCRVILGNVEKVEAGSGQSRPSSANFDTGVDNLKHPKQYVVWYANRNTHIIPECVRSGESAVMKWVPNMSVLNLFAKLERSLPSEKVGELKNLCCIYKAGNMGKDMFIKQLRIISGDEMLLSTIRETRG